MSNRNEVDGPKDLVCEMRKRLLYLCSHYEGGVHTRDDLSMTDLLVGLFHHGLYMDPESISMEDRDRFILSEGHGIVCMYIAMTIRGSFDYDEMLSTYGKLDSTFGMYPYKIQLPGVECSTDSLGYGLFMVVGMALPAKYKKQGHRVFCILGDGEATRGSVREAALTTPSYKLGNLITLIDRNKQFTATFSGKPMILEPYGDKWKFFGRNVKETDGCNMAQIINVLDNLSSCDLHVPTVIVCRTIKGKSVSFMERNIGWHAGSLSPEGMEQAIAQIDIARHKERGVTS